MQCHFVKSFITSQQEHLLSELEKYATRNLPRNDTDSVPEIVEYLHVCNQIFQTGKQSGMLTTCVNSYSHGNTLCIGYFITLTSQQLFLAWQTWDLIQTMYYGFIGFCKYFTSKYLGYTIIISSKAAWECCRDYM